MNIKIILAVLIAGICGACSRNPAKTRAESTSAPQVAVTEKSDNTGKPVVDPEKVYASFNAFWAYYSEYITLNLDFQPTDAAGKIISKEKFLEQLKTGQYGPLLVYGNGELPCYRLYPLPENTDRSIVLYMKQFGDEFLQFHTLENKPLPDFDFITISGQHYTAANTKGKIILIKCWFTTCTPCIKEMPALNELVDSYKASEDVLFLSLAINDKRNLQEFLKKTPFHYETVADKGDYMAEKLHVKGYPTHFIVNREGNVVHALTSVTEVKQALEKELAK